MNVKPLKIPTRFYLHGLPIQIVYQDNLADDQGCVGEANYRSSKIILQHIDGKMVQRAQSRQEQWFCHELVHFILEQMDHKLRKDESFVDLFASLLHQAMITFEYDHGDLIATEHLGDA